MQQQTHWLINITQHVCLYLLSPALDQNILIYIPMAGGVVSVSFCVCVSLSLSSPHSLCVHKPDVGACAAE